MLNASTVYILFILGKCFFLLWSVNTEDVKKNLWSDQIDGKATYNVPRQKKGVGKHHPQDAGFNHTWWISKGKSLITCTVEFIVWSSVSLTCFALKVILQLSTSLITTICSRPDSCRHTVFDYSNRLIALQESLTQIPTAPTQSNWRTSCWEWTSREDINYSGWPGLTHKNDPAEDTVKSH